MKEVLNTLKKYQSLANLPRKAFLYRQNTPCQGIYQLLSGQLLLIKEMNRGEHALGFVKPGDFMGIDTIGSTSMHSHSARAVKDSQVGFVPAETVKQMLDNDALFRVAFMSEMCKKVTGLERKTTTQNPQHAKNKLLGLMADWLGQEPGEKDEAVLFPLDFNEMAQLSNSSESNLKKLLGRLQEQALVQIEEKELRIIDPKGIIKAALCV